MRVRRGPVPSLKNLQPKGEGHLLDMSGSQTPPRPTLPSTLSAPGQDKLQPQDKSKNR